LQIPKDHRCHAKLIYPAKLSITIDEKKKKQKKTKIIHGKIRLNNIFILICPTKNRRKTPTQGK
jgi:hypothetical protein